MPLLPTNGSYGENACSSVATACDIYDIPTSSLEISDDLTQKYAYVFKLVTRVWSLVAGVSHWGAVFIFHILP